MDTPLALGGIFSGIDYRDKIASIAAVPAEAIALPASLNTQLGPVLMQGKIPACVSHSVVDVLKLYWFKKTGQWIDFSPRFLDILSAEADIPLDGGRRPRTVFKVAFKQGCCTTKTLPNDVNLSIGEYRNINSISAEAYTEALQYKIPGYIQVALDFNSMRTNIYVYGALSTLFAVGDQMYLPSWSPKDTDPLRTPNPVTSGHQMTVKGWVDDQYNLLRNEWSESWGVKGEVRYDPKAWSPFVYEAWTPAEIPDDVATMLRSLPSASNFHYQWNKDLKLGDYNDDVKFVQIALMILGILQPIKPEDIGHYGPKTSAAVLAYQQSKRISPTAPNNIGPKTRAALNKQFAL